MKSTLRLWGQKQHVVQAKPRSCTSCDSEKATTDDGIVLPGLQYGIFASIEQNNLLRILGTEQSLVQFRAVSRAPWSAPCRVHFDP